MFEFFKRIAGADRSNSGHPVSSNKNDDVVFWVDMPTNPTDSADLSANSMSRTVVQTASPKALHAGAPSGVPATYIGSHRERLLAMRLDHLKLCPSKRCQQLAAVGIQTAGDLVYGDPKKFASTFHHPERAERALRRYRSAIRMSLAIDSMMPRDALLLVAIHRRSVASLSRESAAQLHRDLERFSLSTRGSKLVGRRGVPSLRRIKGWISTCRELAENSSAANAVPVAA